MFGSWQVTEGVRYLLNTLYLHPAEIKVMIDNKAALTAASFGATWRTRYYAVRAKRLLEEAQQGRARLSHCPHERDGGGCLDEARGSGSDSSVGQCHERLLPYPGISAPDVGDARPGQPW